MDSASGWWAIAHCAQLCRVYRRRVNVVACIEPDNRTYAPINPDLNRVDYAIWGPCMSESTRKFDTVNQLNVNRKTLLA